MSYPTLEQAKAECPERFTMEHVPDGAREVKSNGLYLAPDFESDKEWYSLTRFARNSRGEIIVVWIAPSKPLGIWLTKPYVPCACENCTAKNAEAIVQIKYWRKQVNELQFMERRAEATAMVNKLKLSGIYI